MQDKIKKAFPTLFEQGRLRFNEPLSIHCSFKIGGPADIFAEPQSEQEIIDLLLFALRQNIDYFILGNGSNLLISDKGYRGLVIVTSRLNKISRDEECISAYCGAVLSQVCNYALEFGLSGLEFASGIPGTVGGAVFMNAGAYGGEVKDTLYLSRCLNPEPTALTAKNPVIYLKNSQHHFAYRSSLLQTNSLILLSSVFKLSKEAPQRIKDKMDELKSQRNSKQPMNLPSAGSVFKRPDGHFTGQLIDECGLRGYRIGDAAISEKHCGFIVNLGKASFQDVVELIRYTQTLVKERFGVLLEPEIRIIGEL